MHVPTPTNTPHVPPLPRTNIKHLDFQGNNISPVLKTQLQQQLTQAGISLSA